MSEAAAYERIVMAADAATVASRARSWPRHRPWEMSDLEWHAELAFATYPLHPPDDTREAMWAETLASFDGTWGEVIPEASPVALGDQGEPVGAVLTVRRIVHPEAPDWPYVIGVLTDAAWQRRGIASALLGIAARAVLAGGDARMGLTVDADSEGAVRLYTGLGFVEVSRGVAGAVRDSAETPRQAPTST